MFDLRESELFLHGVYMCLIDKHSHATTRGYLRTDDGHYAANGVFIVDKKVGRNDPCPCGSGKKFKNCCLGKASKEE